MHQSLRTFRLQLQALLPLTRLLTICPPSGAGSSGANRTEGNGNKGKRSSLIQRSKRRVSHCEVLRGKRTRRQDHGVDVTVGVFAGIGKRSITCSVNSHKFGRDCLLNNYSSRTVADINQRVLPASAPLVAAHGWYVGQPWLRGATCLPLVLSLG
jgi:hypothetical protein